MSVDEIDVEAGLRREHQRAIAFALALRETVSDRLREALDAEETAR